MGEFKNEFNVFYATASADDGSVPGSDYPAPTEVKEEKEGDPLIGDGWTILQPGAYAISRKKVDVIPAGVYQPCYNNSWGYYLDKKQYTVDELLYLPSTPIEKILQEFKDFWNLKPKFDKRGFVHKRGYLLHGPPGSGKTSLINLMIHRFIKEHNGVVFIADDPSATIHNLESLRKVEPERPVIVTIEDFDSQIRRKGEDLWLQLFDGNLQMNSVVFVATTNYPTQIDKRFTARPSRFDTLQEVGMPEPEARRYFLVKKEPSLNEDELNMWVKKTEGFSIAHLKELLIAVKCLGQDFDKAAERVEGMTKPFSKDENQNAAGAGFLSRK